MDLITQVTEFLHDQAQPEQSLLVALSGGPDSMALLHLLLRCSTLFPLKLRVAHVDHQWRKESSDEAALLKAKVRSWGVPFHLKVLDRESETKENEAAAREARYDFFESLAARHQCYTLCLGHHQDDVAETVLKRICEGASLTRLAPLRAVAEWGPLQLWRPLLKASKQELETYCQKEKLAVFDDISNRDPRYQRSRLRGQLLPFCQEQVGKEVRTPLATLSAEAEQLQDYLDFRCDAYWEQLSKGALGLCLDLSGVYPSHRYEMQYLLRRLGDAVDISFCRSQLDTVCSLLEQGVAHRSTEKKGVCLHVDRRRLFLRLGSPLPTGDRQPLKLGRQRWGAWVVELLEGKTKRKTETGWPQVWRGQCGIHIPEELPIDELSLGPPERRASYATRGSLDRWWSEQRVPAFMRDWVPVVYHNDTVYHEFLGETATKSAGESSRFLSLYYTG